MLRILACSFCFAFSGAVHADDDCLEVKIVDSYYPLAREELIKTGWKPKYFVPPFEGARYSDWVKIRNYAEVESCAGTGLAPCRFLFELNDDEDSILIVFTQGEEIGSVTGYKCAR